MAKKNQKQTQPNEMVTCYSCKYAYLMQREHNPIISLCKISMNKQGIGQREVARQKRYCDKYVKGFPLPVINPMIPA